MWLGAALSGGETVGLARVPLLAFVRLITREGLFPNRLSLDEGDGPGRRLDGGAGGSSRRAGPSAESCVAYCSP